jgi:anti-anti-sigma factor
MGTKLVALQPELAHEDGNIDDRSAKPFSWEIVVVSEKHECRIAVLTPAGRLDNETSASFQAKLLDAVGSGEPVLLDFSAIKYISSAGLRALLMASRKAKALGGHLGVAALTPMVKEIFSIGRFSLVVQVFETTEEATGALT